MGMGFAPTWLRRVSPPLLHKTTLTTGQCICMPRFEPEEDVLNILTVIQISQDVKIKLRFIVKEYTIQIIASFLTFTFHKVYI